MKQLEALISKVSPDTIQDFFKSKISSFRPIDENFDHLLTDTESERFSELQKLGEAELPQADELLVFGCKMNGRITERSAKKMQYTAAKKCSRKILKMRPSGLFTMKRATLGSHSYAENTVMKTPTIPPGNATLIL